MGYRYNTIGQRAPLFALVVSLGSTTVLFGQEHPSAETEIIAVFDRYTTAIRAEQLGDALQSFHPLFRRWNLAQQAPVDLATLRSQFERYLARSDIVSYVVTPLVVQATGTTAVALVRYEETVRDSAGHVSTNAGSWSATLVREAGRWLFLSWTFLPATVEQRWSRASHLMITGWVAGIVQAKARGGSAEELGALSGRAFAIGWVRLRDAGLPAIYAAFERNVSAFRGTVIDVSHMSDTLIAGQMTRPYAASYFGSRGEYAGVTLEEYETALYHCYREIFASLGIAYRQQVSEDHIGFTFSRVR